MQCTSGAEKHYVSFYPQGRMDLYAALAENRVPVTEKCVEIAESCDLCGRYRQYRMSRDYGKFGTFHQCLRREQGTGRDNSIRKMPRGGDSLYNNTSLSCIRDSVTGKSLRFNALYYPVRSLQHIRDIYLDDIKHNGIKSAECGIYINDEGVLHLPVRIFIPHEGAINLIPVDYFTETILSIIERPVTEAFYHITTWIPATS